MPRRRPTASKRATPKTPDRWAKGWATRRAKQARGPAETSDAIAEAIAEGGRIAAEEAMRPFAEARAAEAAAGPNIAQRAMAIGEQRDALMASARDTGFAFRLGQRVVVNLDTVATVIGRADHEVGTCEYLCHYRQADGREVERWWVEELLSAEL